MGCIASTFKNFFYLFIYVFTAIDCYKFTHHPFHMLMIIYRKITLNLELTSICLYLCYSYFMDQLNLFYIHFFTYILNCVLYCLLWFWCMNWHNNRYTRKEKCMFKPYQTHQTKFSLHTYFYFCLHCCLFKLFLFS